MQPSDPLDDVGTDVVALGRGPLPEELPTHRHRRALLVLGLRGTLSVRTPETTWLVSSQSAIWIPEETPHNVRASNDHESCVLMIEPKRVPPALSGLCCSLRTSSLLRELVERCADLPPSETARRERLTAVLLDELASARPEANFPLTMPSDERLRRIAEAVLRRPSERTSVEDWAWQAGMSGRTFRRQFRSEAGMSFVRWRQQLCVGVAIRRLALGDTVKSIAAELGYESASAFIAMFKRVTNTPPQRYLRPRE